MSYINKIQKGAQEYDINDTRIPAPVANKILGTDNNGAMQWQDAPANGVTSIGGSTGAITLGSGLSMTGNELSASGGGSAQNYLIFDADFSDPSSLQDINITSEQSIALKSNAYQFIGIHDISDTSIVGTTYWFNKMMSEPDSDTATYVLLFPNGGSISSVIATVNDSNKITFSVSTIPE